MTSVLLLGSAMMLKVLSAKPNVQPLSGNYSGLMSRRNFSARNAGATRSGKASWGLTQSVDFFKLFSQGSQDGVLAYLFQVSTHEGAGGVGVPR